MVDSFLSVIKNLTNIDISFNTTSITNQTHEILDCLLYHNCSTFEHLSPSKDKNQASNIILGKDTETSRETLYGEYQNPFLEMLFRYIGYQLGSVFNNTDKECKYTVSIIFTRIKHCTTSKPKTIAS
ncbi:hypothetical protein RF11_00393 [Thelohanellus kitauei]|uniref:Uncharacterized protein n=1 Tax=Thelohanellus kitauei TaxID=669202 RepID=A0A0C2MQP6_THEKT|nr:hypothetical protein RF11_00393 [Thelohanellus kitauei]